MAKTTSELIPKITTLLEKNNGAMGIGEFLQEMRAMVMSTRLLMDALEEMANDGKIFIDDGQIKSELQPA